jgi:hypothetical protein
MNAWGTADLMLAFRNARASRLEPGTLGATFYIPTALVPALLTAHALSFGVLVNQAKRRSGWLHRPEKASHAV